MNWDRTSSMSAFENLLAVLVLVLLNAFFVAAELALVRVRDTQVGRARRKRAGRRAKTARHIVAHI
jgi:CBS domain containing-hemolysin-like protein